MSESTVDIEAMTKEVKKLKRMASEAAMELHDVAEECPARWEEIPAAAEKAFARHTAYFEAKKNLEALDASA